MSKLYVTEYAEIAWLPGNRVAQVPVEPAIVDQSPVDFSGGAASSSAFNAATKYVRITGDAVCSVAFGSNPTATTSNQRMAAGAVEYKAVTPGHKVSAISNT